MEGVYLEPVLPLSNLPWFCGCFVGVHLKPAWYCGCALHLKPVSPAQFIRCGQLFDSSARNRVLIHERCQRQTEGLVFLFSWKFLFFISCSAANSWISFDIFCQILTGWLYLATLFKYIKHAKRYGKCFLSSPFSIHILEKYWNIINAKVIIFGQIFLP